MCKASWLRYFVVAIALFVFLAGVQSAVRAADLEKLDTSLKIVPSDAAFYTSSMRNREQLELFLKSNAFAKLKAMPVAQMGLQMFKAQAANPQSEVSQALTALKNPEVKKIVDLAADMFSNEVFLYGDESCIDFLDLFLEMNNTSTFGPMMAELTGNAQGLSPDQVQKKAMVATLVENIDVVAVPNLLMGFKLENSARANEELIKLEAIVNMIFMQAPPQFQNVFKREAVAGHEYLVLRLNGKMIPWEGDEEEELIKEGLDAEDAGKLIKHVKEMNLAIAIGVRDNYLLASIGSSTACIEKLGGGDSLAKLPQMKPLAEFADRKLTSISYVGAEMNQTANSQDRWIDKVFAALDAGLARTELDKEKKKKILGDAQAFLEEIKNSLPKVGAEVAFSFLADQGVETYDYQWGTHPQIDGSKPLDLLEHVGGNPIFGIVSRGKSDIKDYDHAIKWFSIGWNYFNEFAVPKMKDAEREKFELYSKELLPLAARLDKANRESMIPALANGQVALVFDGKFESKQFFERLPEWEKAMPLPELALVIGVSDANLLKKGVKEYLALALEAVEIVRKKDPQVFEDFARAEKSAHPEGFKLPEMTVTEGSGYTIYGCSLPPELGVDKNFVPNAGLSDHVAVLSLSAKHSERLLKKTPLAVGGVLAKTDRPLASAVWFAWADLLDTAMPWIDFGLNQIDDPQFGGDRQSAIDQIHTVLEVLKCYRSITVESRVEEGCLVTHSLLEIRDVKK